jgi:hypothetical protein
MPLSIKMSIQVAPGDAADREAKIRSDLKALGKSMVNLRVHLEVKKDGKDLEVTKFVGRFIEVLLTEAAGLIYTPETAAAKAYDPNTRTINLFIKDTYPVQRLIGIMQTALRTEIARDYPTETATAIRIEFKDATRRVVEETSVTERTSFQHLASKTQARLDMLKQHAQEAKSGFLNGLDAAKQQAKARALGLKAVGKHHHHRLEDSSHRPSSGGSTENHTPKHMKDSSRSRPRPT